MSHVYRARRVMSHGDSKLDDAPSRQRVDGGISGQALSDLSAPDGGLSTPPVLLTVQPPIALTQAGAKWPSCLSSSPGQ